MAQIFEKLIETEYPHHLDSKPYDIDLVYDLSSTFDGFYQGSCEFDISLYSLNGKVDEMAEILKDILLEFCLEFKGSRGHVCIASSKASYPCDEHSYFDEYEDGLVVLEDTVMEVADWLHLNYIEGLEWTTVIPALIASRVQDLDLIASKGNVFCDYVSDDILLLKSNKGILNHKRKDYASIYPNFKECLRPGFSEWDIVDVRSGGEDLYFQEGEYEIKGSRVKFSRGDFDFITVPY